MQTSNGKVMWNWEFCFFLTFSAILRLSRDGPVVTGGGNRVQAKATTKPTFTGNFLTCHRWDSNPDRCERQLAVSCNALDHTGIRAGPLLDFISSYHCAFFQTWILAYQTPVPHCRGVLHLRHLTIQKLIPVLEHARWTPVD